MGRKNGRGKKRSLYWCLPRWHRVACEHGVGDPGATQASLLEKFFCWDQLRCWPWLRPLGQQLLLQHHGLWNELRVLCTSGFSLWWSRQRHSSPWSTLHIGKLPPGVSGSHTGRTLAVTSVIPGTRVSSLAKASSRASLFPQHRGAMPNAQRDDDPRSLWPREVNEVHKALLERPLFPCHGIYTHRVLILMYAIV